jgi:ATP-binding cassette subfamily C protein
MINLELLQHVGNIVAVAGNKPLLMSDPASVWVVEQGKVSVFCVPVLNNQVAGSRLFLFEATVGDILFGIKPVKITEGEVEEKQLGLLAAGIAGTELRQINRETLQKLAGSAWFSCAKLQRELGYRPRGRLEDALPEML